MRDARLPRRLDLLLAVRFFFVFARRLAPPDDDALELDVLWQAAFTLRAPPDHITTINPRTTTKQQSLRHTASRGEEEPDIIPLYADLRQRGERGISRVKRSRPYTPDLDFRPGRSQT
jgi:hypothetical protein